MIEDHEIRNCQSKEEQWKHKLLIQPIDNPRQFRKCNQQITTFLTNESSPQKEWTNFETQFQRLRSQNQSNQIPEESLKSLIQASDIKYKKVCILQSASNKLFIINLISTDTQTT